MPSNRNWEKARLLWLEGGQYAYRNVLESANKLAWATASTISRQGHISQVDLERISSEGYYRRDLPGHIYPRPTCHVREEKTAAHLSTTVMID